MKEKKVQTNGVNRLHSMKAKIILTVFLSSLVTGICLILLMVPSAKSKLQNETEQNMLTMAQGYGQYIDNVQSTMPATYKTYASIVEGLHIDGVESSYVYLVSSNGTMVYHTNQDKVGKLVENSVVSGLVSEILEGNIPSDDVVTYDYKGANKTAAYHILSNNSIFVVTADTDDILSGVNGITNRAIQGGLLILVMVAIIAYFVGKGIATPIINSCSVFKQIENFDFRESETLAKISKRQDEIGQMGRSVQAVCANMRGLIQQIDDASGNITTNVSSLSSITNEINSTCTDNSATTQELAAGMEETTSASENIVANIQTIIDEASRIQQLAADGEKMAEGVKNKASELHKKTDDATANTESMYQQVKEGSSAALEQAKAVEKINELTKAIMDIADQTNLLSLNASIEAARAGEAGKGFAVVADEIGSLAKESASTVGSINEIIVEVNAAVKNMADCLNGAINFLEETVLSDYAQFGEVSVQYNEDAESFNTSMNEIENAVDDLTLAIEDISNAVSGINNTISESAAGVENIAEKTTDIVSRTSKNTDIVEECSDAVDNLKAIVGRFTL